MSKRLFVFTVMFVLLLAGAASAQKVATATQQKTGTVNGVAHDNEGKVVPNATVQIRDIATGKVINTTTCTKDGTFTFLNVPPGKYVIEIVGKDKKVLVASGAVGVTAAFGSPVVAGFVRRADVA